MRAPTWRARQPRRRPSQKTVVGIVFVLSMFMTVMDITIVNVALPTLGHTFDVKPSGTDAVVVGFLVSLAVFIPASGWLGDRFGTKRILLVAMTVFTVGSALCGLAANLTELIGFRVLQGAGGGLLTPVGMAMLYRTYPPAERVRASRILTVPTAFAPALGPVLGGVIITEMSWRWVFFVNVPVGAFAILFGAVLLQEDRQEDPGRFDVAGFALAGAGLSLLMYAASEGPSLGWSSPAILFCAGAGALLTALFSVYELRRERPMLELRLLRDSLLRSTTLVMVLGGAAFLGALYAVALFFQVGLGASPLVAGLSTFPEALGVMAGAQVSGHLYHRFGPRRVITAGLVGVATVLVAMSFIGQGQGSLWVMRGLMFLAGYAMAHAFVPCQAASFTTISPASTGHASTLFNALRQLGSAIGVALLATVIAFVGPFQVELGRQVPRLAAYHIAFLAAAATALLASAAALLVDDEAAAPSIRRRSSANLAEAAAPEPLPV